MHPSAIPTQIRTKRLSDARLPDRHEHYQGREEGLTSGPGAVDELDTTWGSEGGVVVVPVPTPLRPRSQNRQGTMSPPV